MTGCRIHLTSHPLDLGAPLREGETIRSRFKVTPFIRPLSSVAQAAYDGVGQGGGAVREVDEVGGGECNLDIAPRSIGERYQHGRTAFIVKEGAQFYLTASDAGKATHPNTPSVGRSSPTVAEAGGSRESPSGGGSRT